MPPVVRLRSKTGQNITNEISVSQTYSNIANILVERSHVELNIVYLYPVNASRHSISASTLYLLIALLYRSYLDILRLFYNTISMNVISMKEKFTFCKLLSSLSHFV